MKSFTLRFTQNNLKSLHHDLTSRPGVYRQHVHLSSVVLGTKGSRKQAEVVREEVGTAGVYFNPFL